MPAAAYERQAGRAAGFGAAMTRLGAAGHPARVAAAVEFVLEGLHLNRKLNKDRGVGGPRYKA
jgi:magnesium chelatase subunit I